VDQRFSIIVSRLNRAPLRLTVGLILFLVGLARLDILPISLRSYAQPEWLYGAAQLVTGLGLLLTMGHPMHWTGRLAAILAVGVLSMVAWALTELGSTGAIIYGVLALMMIVVEAGRHER
jgi:hypothetical protein